MEGTDGDQSGNCRSRCNAIMRERARLDCVSSDLRTVRVVSLVTGTFLTVRLSERRR